VGCARRCRFVRDARVGFGLRKVLSAIFLAKEYGVQVWAADLWIKPSENYERHPRGKVLKTVSFPFTPMRAVYHLQKNTSMSSSAPPRISTLGQTISYLDYLHQFVKPGGHIGITVPGFMRELNGQLSRTHPSFLGAGMLDLAYGGLVVLALGTDRACERGRCRGAPNGWKL